jgi:hypothetical protein
VPRPAAWLLVCRAPARPRPRRLASARLSGTFRRARYGPPIRTAILSYAEHGRLRADTQGYTLLQLFAAGGRGRKGGSELWLRPLRLGLPQCPADFSGPREPRERNGKCMTRARMTSAAFQGRPRAVGIAQLKTQKWRGRPIRDIGCAVDRLFHYRSTDRLSGCDGKPVLTFPGRAPGTDGPQRRFFMLIAVPAAASSRVRAQSPAGRRKVWLPHHSNRP